MKRKLHINRTGCFTGALICLVLAVVAGAVASDTQTLLHVFSGIPDGASPYASLIADSSGNLYGTTVGGGTHQGGTVFELSPDGNGGWTYNTLYSLTGGNDGKYPWATLAFDNEGNLYGTCTEGGTNSAGTVFELSPGTGGSWTLTRTYSFTNQGGLGTPVAGVVVDSAGNLYGTTQNGQSNHGAAYELTPSGDTWTEQTVHDFTGGTDGNEPSNGGLIMDRLGNLYGTTAFGGTYGRGVVFRLRNTGGGWIETVLYNFTGNADDGSLPLGYLVVDNRGSLYGTTAFTTFGDWKGGVYKLTPPPTASQSSATGAQWQISWLYHFTGGADGGGSYSGVVFDSAGNLYGTTYSGGTQNQSACNGYCGVVFKLTPSPWTESVLWTFTGNADGGIPEDGVFVAPSGNLYGTASMGGHFDLGTVFQLSQ